MISEGADDFQVEDYLRSRLTKRKSVEDGRAVIAVARRVGSREARALLESPWRPARAAEAGRP